MKLHFDWESAQKLLSHSKQATAHQAVYGRKETEHPGLLLVGDNGIYLCSNGLPSLRADGSEGTVSPKNPLMVAYARECDPDQLDFELWWNTKQRSFGGDDGFEFLAAKWLQAALESNNDWLVLEVTPETIKVL